MSEKKQDAGYSENGTPLRTAQVTTSSRSMSVGMQLRAAQLVDEALSHKEIPSKELEPVAEERKLTSDEVAHIFYERKQTLTGIEEAKILQKLAASSRGPILSSFEETKELTAIIDKYAGNESEILENHPELKKHLGVYISKVKLAYASKKLNSQLAYGVKIVANLLELANIVDTGNKSGKHTILFSKENPFTPEKNRLYNIAMQKVKVWLVRDANIVSFIHKDQDHNPIFKNPLFEPPINLTKRHSPEIVEIAEQERKKAIELDMLLMNREVDVSSRSKSLSIDDLTEDNMEAKGNSFDINDEVEYSGINERSGHSEILDLIGYGDRRIPGRQRIPGAGRVYERSDLKDVGDWLQDIQDRGFHTKKVCVGMLNGLLTYCSDFHGSGALALFEEFVTELGYKIIAFGTNDDSTAIIAVPYNEDSDDSYDFQIDLAMQMIAECLQTAMRMFDIQVNPGKMNLSSYVWELNTVVIAETTDGRKTVALPAVREALGATHALPDPFRTSGMLAATNSAASYLKEGGNLVTAYTITTLNLLSAYTACKMDGIALASAANVPHPGGHKHIFQDNPSPLGTGKPDLRPYLAAWPAMDRMAFLTCDRLLKYVSPEHGDRTIRGTSAEDLISNVCKQYTAKIIGSALSVLSEYKFKSDDGSDNDDLSDVIGLLEAVPVGIPTSRVFNTFSPDFYKNLQLNSITTAGSGTKRSAVANIVKAAITGSRGPGQALRAKDSHTLFANHMFSTGKRALNSDGSYFDYKRSHDDSDEPKTMIVTGVAVRGTKLVLLKNRVSLGWYLWHCDTHDWEKKVDLDVPFTKIVIAKMVDNVVQMRKLTRELEKGPKEIIIGAKASMGRCKGVDKPNKIKIEPMPLAAAINPNPFGKAAMNLQGFVDRTVIVNMFETEISILGNKMADSLSVEDLDTMRKIAYILEQLINIKGMKDFIMPTTMSNPTPMDIAAYLATHPGFNMFTKKVLTVSMPEASSNDIHYEHTSIMTNSAACVACAFYLRQEINPILASPDVVGVLPSSVGRPDTSNRLLSSNWKNMLAGLKMAAERNLVLDYDMDNFAVMHGPLNKELMVYTASRPSNVDGIGGVAVRGLTGVTIYRKIRETGEKLSITHCLASVEQATVSSEFRREPEAMKFAVVKGVKLPFVTYRWTHHIFIPISRKEAFGYTLSYSQKFKGNWRDKEVEYKDFVNGWQNLERNDKFIIHWKPVLYAAISCFPPYYCLRTMDNLHDIPIAVAPAEYEMRKDDLKELRSDVQLRHDRKTGKKELFASYKTLKRDVDDSILTAMTQILTMSEGQTVSSAICSAIRVMSPWQAVRQLVLAVYDAAGKLKGSHVYAHTTALTVDNYLDMDIDRVTDMLVGRGTLLAKAYEQDSANIKVHFFSISTQITIFEAVMRLRVDFGGRGRFGKPPKEIANSTANMRRQPIKMKLRSIAEDLPEVRIHTPPEVKEESKEEVVKRATNAFDDIMMGTIASARLNSFDDLDEMDFQDDKDKFEKMSKSMIARAPQEMTDYVDEPIRDDMRSILETANSSKVALQLSEELKIPEAGMDKRGFPEERKFKIREDLVLGIGEDGALYDMPIETPPVLNKKNFEADFFKIAQMASTVLGRMITNQMALRLSRGGGAALWSLSELWGGSTNHHDIEGGKWIRVPSVALASVLSKGSLIHNDRFSRIQNTFLDSLNPETKGSVSVMSEDKSESVISTITVGRMTAPENMGRAEIIQITQQCTIGEALLKIHPSAERIIDIIPETGGREYRDRGLSISDPETASFDDESVDDL